MSPKTISRRIPPILICMIIATTTIASIANKKLVIDFLYHKSASFDLNSKKHTNTRIIKKAILPLHLLNTKAQKER